MSDVNMNIDVNAFADDFTLSWSFCRPMMSLISRRAAVGMRIPMGIPVVMGMGWIWGL